MILKLADKKETTQDLANVIIVNFDIMPNNIQNLLFELADRESAAGYVLWSVAVEYYDLPKNVQNLLYKTSIQK